MKEGEGLRGSFIPLNEYNALDMRREYANKMDWCKGKKG